MGAKQRPIARLYPVKPYLTADIPDRLHLYTYWGLEASHERSLHIRFGLVDKRWRINDLSKPNLKHIDAPTKTCSRGEKNRGSRQHFVLVTLARYSTSLYVVNTAQYLRLNLPRSHPPYRSP